MNRKNINKIILWAITLILGIIGAIYIGIQLFTEGFLVRYELEYILMIVFLISMVLAVIILLTRMLYDSYNNNNMVQLNKLLRYNKQRYEIEQEIQSLTQELMNSDIAQYIDVNRLVFSGQNNNVVCGGINYDNFLKQFGIQKSAVTVRERSAVFLTPFNANGEMLFETCQTILGKADIFLRKTDNIVEKDDILMNIVSLIVQSELVLVNIDGRNPNVYYELGIAHALGKPTILLSKSKYTLNDIGFDVRQKRIIIYENKKDLETELLSQISKLKK